MVGSSYDPLYFALIFLGCALLLCHGRLFKMLPCCDEQELEVESEETEEVEMTVHDLANEEMETTHL